MNTMKDDFQKSINQYIRRYSDVYYTDEYNCRLRRLFPWAEKVNTKRTITEFGCIWVCVEPGQDVDRHGHDEEETFIVISGQAELTIEEQTTSIGFGDVVYIPRNYQHQLRNIYSQPFLMIDIYWDWGGTSESAL